jgi:hypothetical protein
MRYWQERLPGVATTREPLHMGRRGLRIMTLTGTVAFLIGVTACTGPATSNRDSSTPAAKHIVKFFAEGTETKWAAVTMRTESGGISQFTPDLPMVTKAGDVGLTFDTYPSGSFLYFSMQNKEGYGSVTCRITIDGVKVDEATSSGGYAIATCQGKVP